MSRFGRSYGIGLHRSLKPPSDKEVLWYKYDEDEFYHYDFSVGEWKSYGEHYEKRIAALEEQIENLINASFYTNPNPLPEKVGGYEKGTTFDKVSDYDWKTRLLYPYQYPRFTYFKLEHFDNFRYEVGTVINGVQPFIWNIINVQNIVNASIEISGQNIPVMSNLSNTGRLDIAVDNVTRLSKGTYSWLISALNTKGQTISETATIRWDFKQFWGTSASETLTAAAIENLKNSRLTPSTVLNKTYQFDANDYKFFVFAHNEYTAPRKFLDVDTGLGVQMYQGFDNSQNSISYDLVTVTNANGIQKQYRVYRTAFVLDLAVNVEVT